MPFRTCCFLYGVARLLSYMRCEVLGGVINAFKAVALARLHHVAMPPKGKPPEPPLQHYWELLSIFGSEVYKTWRWELCASALTGVGTLVASWSRGDPAAWASFLTALKGIAYALGAFAFWHLLRTPYLAHVHYAEGTPAVQRKFGIVGMFFLIGLLEIATQIVMVVPAHRKFA
jgi:hypothetical protein